MNSLDVISTFIGLSGVFIGLYGLGVHFYIAWTCFDSIHTKITGQAPLANDIVYKTWHLYDYTADAVFSLNKKLNDPKSGYNKLTKHELRLLKRCGYATLIGIILFAVGVILTPS